MVGLATRASNNHINQSVLGGKGNINSMGWKYREKYRWRVTEVTQVRQNGFRTLDRPTVFFKDDKTRAAGNPSQHFTTRTENAPILHRRRFGPCSNLKICSLSPARYERRKKSDGQRSTSPLNILKAKMRSARRRLYSIEKRLSLRSLLSYGMWQTRPTSRIARRCARSSWFMSTLSVVALALIVYWGLAALWRNTAV